MIIENLKDQHQNITKQVAELDREIGSANLVEKAFDLSMKLAKLFGLLSIHLGSEDKFLYPKLLQHTNPQVKATAERFSNEMGGIAQALDDYKRKYMSAGGIKADPEGFKQATQTIFAALGRRVHLEESQLYPLLD